jgi:hypothetical protein
MKSGVAVEGALMLGWLHLNPLIFFVAPSTISRQTENVTQLCKATHIIQR